MFIRGHYLAVAVTASGVGLGLEARVVRLLEDHVLHQRLGYDELRYDPALLVHGLADDHTCRFRLEEHTAGGDVGSATIHLGGRTDARESHLEDADAVEAHLLAELEEVLHGAAQLVEHGLDVALLD